MAIRKASKFDMASVERARAWRDAAVADGWSIEPTYQTEPVERAARLSRDGFSAQIITRTPEEGHRWRTTYEGSVHIWGPDSLAVKAPHPYSWERLTAGLRTCHDCGATDVETQRVGFAGRTCAACLPDARKRIETPGWTN